MHDADTWRRWRSRFYLWLLLAMMAAIAVAGAWNVRRLTRPVAAAPSSEAGRPPVQAPPPAAPARP